MKTRLTRALVESDKPEFPVMESGQTQKGFDLFVVRLAQRVSRD